uniref:Uncharacterized protein n=1 Tax=Arundo donax TaxID=35708 RepID=A0A0A9C5J6_ARUDO
MTIVCCRKEEPFLFQFKWMKHAIFWTYLNVLDLGNSLE